MTNTAHTRSIAIAAVLMMVSAWADASTRDREFARSSLERTVDAKQLLDRTKDHHSDEFRERFLEPMDQLVRRWSRRESALMFYPSCGSAAKLLYRIGSAMRRTPSKDWLSDQRRQYGSAISNCRREVNRR